MSSGREKFNGNISGGNFRANERRDTLNLENETDKSPSSKRARINPKRIESSENFYNESNDSDRYLITYADLITLLLGLFIILYAISNIDLNKYQNMKSAMGDFFGSSKEPVSVGIAQQKLMMTKKIDPIAGLRNDLENLIKTENLKESIKLEENERGFTIHIMEQVLFNSGKAELNEQSRIVLHNIAGILSKLPNDIRVEGHTDNIPIKNPSFTSNWHLSVARALNTAYHFIQEEGLNPEKVSIVGYSEYKPIASNATEDGRAVNRRVDITILKM